MVGEEAEGFRSRAIAYKEMARQAVEGGGLSYTGLTTLLQEISSYSSTTNFTASQMQELAMGIEDSGQEFIWVVRTDNEDWLPEGFEGTKEKRINHKIKRMSTPSANL
ncbi:hypothetical protein RND71_041677 [Anisodus tanguticus]|uniref:Uncharacterized protein n=1 Tax=Anisodus tanguticus TaxID=243964 RepID=A0AAE1QV76_9SOLA|nr:hypothetical protein RND71_041677 [Anisodus tanguticus]